MKALWTQPKVTYRGQIFQVEDGVMGPKPVQKPHPPVWLGGGHPDALRRAALSLMAGWELAAPAPPPSRECPVGTGGAGNSRARPSLPISKRVFMSVHERPEVAEAEVHRWFSEVYHNPNLTTKRSVRHARASAGAARRARSHGRHPPAAQSRHPLCRTGRSTGRGGWAVALVLSSSEEG